MFRFISCSIRVFSQGKGLLLVFSVLGLLALSLACGGGGGGGTPATTSSTTASDSTAATTTTTTQKTWNGSSSAITIDNIANSSGSSKPGRQASSTAEFYYGRFVINTGVGTFAFKSGSCKFKIKKENDSQAYFSNFTLLNFSQATNYDANTSIVSSETDLNVPTAYNATTNSITISDATSRFVAFNIDFGNNDYFGDVSNAGIRFSDDFTTLSGGDNQSFILIAQKTTSQAEIGLNDLEGNWNFYSFTVDSNGTISVISGTSPVTASGTGGNGYKAFTGTDVNGVYYDGEYALNDSKSGFYYYGYGAGVEGTTPTATAPVGLFLVAADKELILGYNASATTYFVGQKQ